MKNTRRKFLTDLGITVGTVLVGNDILKALPPLDDDQKGRKSGSKSKEVDTVDFRYSPANWQSTYCFPDDPYKSLVGKHGELLYGHTGPGSDLDAFPHIVTVGMPDHPKGDYVAQHLESPSIPIITTTVKWGEVTAVLTSFATNNKDEGRVDNLIIEFRSKGTLQSSPEIIIASKSKFVSETTDASSSPRKKLGIVRLDTKASPFMVVDSPIVSNESGEIHRFQLPTAGESQPVKFFARFPQEGQTADRIKDGFGDPDKLLLEARTYWQAWQPFEGKVNWKINSDYHHFLSACARNILQAREIKNGKKVFQVGPTVYRGFWVVDGHFMLEAARYLGYDKEAQEGLESMWDLQDEKGGFTAGAGETHWKDTAVAIYSLVRQAELTQNWDYFNSMYPDAYKAVMYLRDLRTKGLNDGSANGTYGLLPRGFGDSGIGGTRSEFTNTLWTLLACKRLLEISEKLMLWKRQDIRDFHRDLQISFSNAMAHEMRQHKNGFSYLPMLMKEDPQWAESDERKQPRPQAAQIYLSQAIYPGMIFPIDDPVVLGHIELMKAVTQEDIPIETGWLTDQGAWPYNAAIVAQVYLWTGQTELAHKTFTGFLNHASPLFAWREEQSLKSNPKELYVGDMPHNWASAECIRYLRHRLVFEDEAKLRLFAGTTHRDFDDRKPFSVTYSPTRWGRVSFSHEPLDNKHWITKFKREEFDAKLMPELKFVTTPRKLPVNLQLDKMTGAHFVKNGPEVLIDPLATSWEAIWIDIDKVLR